MGNSQQQDTAEIAIAGAGLVGALTALMLAQRFPQWRVVLIDPAQGLPKQDPRTLALALRSQMALAELQVWQQISSATPIEHIHISDSTGPGSATLHASKEGVQSLGYVVQAADVQQALAQACEAQTNIDWRRGESIQQVQAATDASVLTLTSGAQVSARLLVVTDGSHSPTRSLLGVGMQSKSYGQTAIAGFIETDTAHQQTAYERFTAEGPLALLPFGPRRYALIWCAKADTVQELMALPEDDFRHKAQALFGSRAGYFTGSERVGFFPLSLAVAERFIGHRFAVIGNACHTLHPVAGQGYNLGVRDALVLKQVLEQSNDPGEAATLQQYAELRRKDYQHVQTFTDSLVNVFSTAEPCVSFARRCGLKSLRILPTLATPLAQKAMGFGAQETLWR